MPKDTITSKTGSAPIKRQGQTAVNAFGANPSARSKGAAAEAPRDLKAK